MTDQLQPVEQEPTSEELDFEQALVDEIGKSPEVEVAPTETPDAPEPDSPEPQAPQEPQEDEWTGWAKRIKAIADEKPELWSDFVRLERGEAVAIPKEVLEAAQNWGQQNQQQPQPTEQAPGFYDDPETYVRSLEERVARHEQWLSARSQQEQMETQARTLSLVNEVAEDFRRRHPELSDDQWADFTRKVGKAQLVAANLEEFNGDQRRAVAESFEQGYRAFYPQPSQKDQLETQRQRKRAGATAASPRSARRLAPEEPKNTEERRRGLVEGVREALANNA